VKTLKSASTYYGAVFRSTGWRNIDFSEINWDVDYVFGLIMDPVTRYIKGLVEDSQDPDIHQIVKSVLSHKQEHNCILTTHCLPLSLVHGDYIHCINWIPLDCGLDVRTILQKNCKQHGVDLIWDDHSGNEHRGSPEKIDLYQDLKSKFDTGNGNFYSVFAKDIDLYSRTKSLYNDLYASNSDIWNPGIS
jgi:hypothetical protein